MTRTAAQIAAIDLSTRRLASMRPTEADAARIQTMAIESIRTAQPTWIATEIAEDIDAQIASSLVRGSVAVKRISHALAAVEAAFWLHATGRIEAERVLLAGMSA